MSEPEEDAEKQDSQTQQSESGIDVFPFIKTIRGYSKQALIGDLRAAINVSLLAFPQGMAYAAICGLPLRYGIFGTAVAGIMGAFFAGSKFIALGPSNATAVMVLSAFSMLGIVTEQEAMAQIPMLLFIVGVVLIMGAALRVSSLIQYISRSVIGGYITAAATLIIVNQLRKALGFSFTPEERLSASTFFEVLYRTFLHLKETHWPTLVLSCFSFAVYYALNRYLKKLPNVAITLAISGIVAWLAARLSPNFSVALLPSLDVSMWAFTPPQFDYESLHSLLSPAIAIALICMLEGNSIGKSLAAREGARMNGNQETFAVGMANIGCALFSGIAASGSLTRSKLNVSSGALTPIASLFVGILVALGAFGLADVIRFVPIASLAVIIICIGFSLINKHQLRIITKTTRSDSVTFYVTFVTGLFFALDFAIYAGTCCSIALFLKKVANPEIVEYAFNESGQLGQIAKKEQRADPEVSIVHVEGELFFGAAELFRDQMRRVADDPNLKIVVMKLRNAYNLDATSCMALEELIRYMNERDRILLVSEVRPDTLRTFKNSDLIRSINPINLFEDDENNPTLSTAKALKRAKEILGGLTPKVSIYAKEKRAAAQAALSS